MTRKHLSLDISSAGLHILAMALMLCDHMWATVLGQFDWLTAVGRIAFPLFAFMVVEGYFHTRSFKRYMQRLLIFALLSEIPFNLMYSTSLFYPLHQNVLWTFLIALCLIRLMDKIRAKGRLWLSVLVCSASVLLGLLLGFALFVDYYGVGVLTVLVFYFFRRRSWWCLLAQFLALYYLNAEMLGGLVFPMELFGHSFHLAQQSLALLALIPIWLYRGRQGYHSKAFQYICYAFYPVHMLILALIMILL